MSRRSLLKAGAFTVGAFATGATLLKSKAAQAAIPQNLPYMSNVAKVQLFKNQSFGAAVSGHRMQSFAFDSVNKKMFAAGLLNGFAEEEGYLQVARILIGTNAGTPASDPMIIKNAGHAVAFGIEPIGTDSYIWIEYGADSTGFGSKLARFKYVPGRQIPADYIDATGSFGGDRQMLFGSNSVSCSVDHIFPYGDGLPRLAVHRKDADADGNPVNGTYRYEIYKLHGLSAAPELEWAWKADPANFSVGGVKQTWQGWQFYGGQFYTITGDHGANNTRIWKETPPGPYTTDWHLTSTIPVSGSGPQSVPTGITDAEPEGIAAYRPGSDEQVGLYFGYASGDSTRLNSVYYRLT